MFLIGNTFFKYIIYKENILTCYPLSQKSIFYRFFILYVLLLLYFKSSVKIYILISLKPLFPYTTYASSTDDGNKEKHKEKI